jgi:hypothetical protein
MHPSSRGRRAPCPATTRGCAGVRRMHVPVHAANGRASCAPSCGLFQRTLAATDGGPGRARAPARLSRAKQSATRTVAFASARRMRVASGPPSHCGGSGRDARRVRVMDRAHSAACTRMCNPRNTGRGRVLFGQEPEKRNELGRVSLLTFFARAKKVSRSPKASGSSAMKQKKVTGFRVPPTATPE